ncbi:hypothetical protein ACFYXJ_35050 [Streptomyces sp. NPDC002667]|uniref:hypothetical protein n=1 Tax=Streptomyces sp. NPDC002667 TaxID=3364657 RepID=UPI0036BE2948
MGEGTAPVRTAEGRAVAGSEVRAADGVRPKVGVPVVRAVGTGTVRGAVGLADEPTPPGRGLAGPGDTEGVGSAGGPVTDGGARGTTGATGASGVADRRGSTKKAPTAHTTAAPAAALRSRRRTAPLRIAS